MHRFALIVGTGLSIPPILLVGLAIFHTWAYEVAAEEAAATIESLRSDIAERRRCLNEYDRIQSQEAPVIDRLRPVLSKTVGRIKAPPRFLPLLERTAARCNVTITSCRWSKSSQPSQSETARSGDPGVESSATSSYRTVAFYVTVTGSAGRILAFIGALESDPRPISITAVDIKRKGNPRLPLTARVTANVVVRA